AGDTAVTVDFDDAEAVRLFGIHEDGGERDVGAGLAVLAKHPAVIHLVDVITGKDEHVLGLLGPDGVDVLVNRVSGSHVPILANPLHGREDFDKLAEFPGDDVPAFADVTIQGKSFVLSKDVDAMQAGVDTVGKSDIDDAIDAAESDGRLGTITSQGIEAFAGASG